jgi:hypothetical protein
MSHRPRTSTRQGRDKDSHCPGHSSTCTAHTSNSTSSQLHSRPPPFCCYCSYGHSRRFSAGGWTCSGSRSIRQPAAARPSGATALYTYGVVDDIDWESGRCKMEVTPKFSIVTTQKRRMRYSVLDHLSGHAILQRCDFGVNNLTKNNPGAMSTWRTTICMEADAGQ